MSTTELARNVLEGIGDEVEAAISNLGKGKELTATIIRAGLSQGLPSMS
jgi:hypothetical protein